MARTNPWSAYFFETGVDIIEKVDLSCRKYKCSSRACTGWLFQRCVGEWVPMQNSRRHRALLMFNKDLSCQRDEGSNVKANRISKTSSRIYCIQSHSARACQPSESVRHTCTAGQEWARTRRRGACSPSRLRGCDTWIQRRGGIRRRTWSGHSRSRLRYSPCRWDMRPRGSSARRSVIWMKLSSLSVAEES